MGKRAASFMATVAVGVTGGLTPAPAVEATAYRDMAVIEQTATGVEDVGQAANDASSADEVVKEAEVIKHQLTSESEAHPSPEPNPEGDDPQKDLLDLAGDEEEKKRAAAKADQERADAAAEADQERADEESHQQAAAEDEAQFGGPAEDSAPEDSAPEDSAPEDSEPADETWLEDDDDVNDPDID